MNVLQASVVFLILINKNESDNVVYPTNGTTWSSVTFDLPVEAANIKFWPICGIQSRFYCLSDFRSDLDDINPAVECKFADLNLYPDLYHKFWKHRANAKLASVEAFDPSYRRHNFFVTTESCCNGQFNTYYAHGLQGLKITPKEYFSKLTDYAEKNKILNLIWSYYLEDCDVNIITKIGFGKGDLKRYHYQRGLSFHGIDKPYRLKIGQLWSPDVAYEHPEQILTFKWFKEKIMCRDQPWICGKQRWKLWN